MRNRLPVVWLTGLLLLCLASCRSSRPATTGRSDNFTYFQTDAPAADSLGAALNAPYTFRLSSGDVVAITVSSVNKDADAQFNPYSTFYQQLNGANTQSNNIPQGYIVSAGGTINFPKLGPIAVLGMTTVEVEQLLAQRLKAHLLDPFVSVRLINFKISVLGEVVRPSVYTIQNERITLTEALSLAGDLTPFGRRDDVLLIREQDGKRTFAHIDLRDRSLFQSPYYYLRPNDMVYVSARGGRKLQSSSIFTWLPTVVSGVSLVVLLYSSFIR